MDNFIIAFILLLVFSFVSRTITEKANKKLDQVKKAELVDLFSKDRIFTYGTVIVVFALFYFSIKFNLVDPVISYVAYIVLMFALIVATGISSYRRLKANDFPDAYIRSYLMATSLRVVGMVIFFVFVKF